MDTPIDRREQPVHLIIGGRHRLVEPQDPALLDIDAVEHERVDVDVQIQRGAAASEHRPHEDARDRAAQRVVPRQHVPQAMRQTQPVHPSRSAEIRANSWVLCVTSVRSC
jgi:hypothetical protein